MHPEKIRTFIILGFLVVSAFVSRFEIFIRPQPRSIDEAVYYNLGRQLAVDVRDYNTIAVAKYLTEERGRTLPPYFTQPLFKHPPLFPMLIAGAVRLLGDDMASAEVVSLGFGVAMIPLVYLLGNLAFGRLIGLMAAFFVFIDPISIMSSQKVWMDTTLSFFTVLSVVLFFYGSKLRRDSFFILSGLSTGLAFLTKYPGILPVIVQALYAALYRQDLFRKRAFWLCLSLPFILALPWFYWNFCVYGLDAIAIQLGLHNFTLNIPQTLIVLVFVGVLVLFALVAGFLKQGRTVLTACRPLFDNDRVRIVGATLFFAYFAQKLFLNFQSDHLPVTSWSMGLFQYENFGFYFGHLMEYSLIYAFAFLGFFVRLPDGREDVMLFRIASLVILGFYVACGNYQSRYILAAIPFLVVLGARTWEFLWEFVSTHRRVQIRLSGRVLLLSLMMYLICKTMVINYFLSFTNNMCFF